MCKIMTEHSAHTPCNTDNFETLLPVKCYVIQVSYKLTAQESVFSWDLKMWLY